MAVKYMLCSKKKKARNVEVDERKGKKNKYAHYNEDIW